MSETLHSTPLHGYVHTSFRAAFGQPSTTLQRDDHWSITTMIDNQPINVLVNGTPATPAVWMFDPHELSNPVYSTMLANEGEVDAVIILIQNRIRRGGHVLPKRAGAAPGDLHQ